MHQLPLNFPLEYDIIRPLCIRLPQVIGCARKFNENSTMSFIIKDKKLLKNI